MLVIADSSPIIALVNIGHVNLLPTLFGDVVIPPEVSSELHGPNRADPVRKFIAHRPACLVERTPMVVESIPSLHPAKWRLIEDWSI
jgi:hypothetical protein